MVLIKRIAHVLRSTLSPLPIHTPSLRSLHFIPKPNQFPGSSNRPGCTVPTTAARDYALYEGHIHIYSKTRQDKTDRHTGLVNTYTYKHETPFTVKYTTSQRTKTANKTRRRKKCMGLRPWIYLLLWTLTHIDISQQLDNFRLKIEIRSQEASSERERITYLILGSLVPLLSVSRIDIISFCNESS